MPIHTLGKLARDKITGFEGIITSRVTFLYGCDQYCLVPKTAEGKINEGQYFDEGRIEITGQGVAPADVTGPIPSGIQRDAPRRTY